MKMTKEEGAIFDSAFCIDYHSDDTARFLYYYHSDRTVRDILTEDGIQLRLNHVGQFPDKLEGKTIEVYFDIALDELLQEGKINKKQFSILAQANMPDKRFIIRQEERGVSFGAEKKCDAYIICFSTEKDDPCMYENYGNRGKGRYCLSFESFVFKNLRLGEYENNLGVDWIRVFYGKKVVDLLKNWILKYLEDADLSDKSICVLMEDVLHELQYSAKRTRYSFENELRLVVYLPENEEIDSHIFEKYEDKGKKYLRLYLDKYHLYGITADPNNNPEVNEELFACLRDRGYGDSIDFRASRR